MLEPTRYKELCVDITTKRIKGGGYRVKGIAQHPVTGLCYEGIAPKYMTANSEAKIQETCRKVIYTLEQRYASTVLPPEKNALLSERVSAYLDTLLEKEDSAAQQLTALLNSLKRDGVSDSDIVILSPHRMSLSCARLVELGLTLNSRKTYIRRLKQPGDAIHLLGLNLVYVEPEKNRITVSDRYIRKTSIEFCDFLRKKDSLPEKDRHKAFLSVYGMIQFIKNASEQSAEKLRRMLEIKLGQSVTLDYKSMEQMKI